jgi:hypothetical protein
MGQFWVANQPANFAAIGSSIAIIISSFVDDERINKPTSFEGYWLYLARYS